jgi:hypothetical protein
MSQVIGSQTNVPEPGDPIASPWPQDTAKKIVHTFADTTARGAWSTRPEGAVAYTRADDAFAVWTGAAWRPIAYADLYLLLTGGTLSGNLLVGGNPATPEPGVLVSPGGAVTSARNTLNAPNVSLNRHGPANATGQVLQAFTLNLAMTSLGTITIASGTSVAYNTTSDPRAKTAPPATRGISDAAERALAIGRNAWQGHHVDPETGQPETGPEWDFVSSHDVEDHAPYAVTGARDAVDAETGAPIFQQVNYGGLVPLLFAALADALERITILETGVAP